MRNLKSLKFCTQVTKSQLFSSFESAWLRRNKLLTKQSQSNLCWLVNIIPLVYGDVIVIMAEYIEMHKNTWLNQIQLTSVKVVLNVFMAHNAFKFFSDF